MCYPTPTVFAVQQAIPNCCPAKALSPSQRLYIGLQALAGTESITSLAGHFDVSRKFVSQQQACAHDALADAFDPPADDQEVLFYLPVTKPWLRQLVLALVLICHSPLRGVVELLRDLFDYDLSLGTVHNIVQAAVAPARAHNQAQDLSRVQVGGHDEIFQAGAPVLVGVDLHTTYCYLLSVEDQRDADTWGVHLLDLQARGLAPKYVVADAGSALRAAQAEVLPDTPCRSDVFHVLQEVTKVVTKLDKRAYAALAASAALQQRIARRQRRGRPDASAHKRLSLAAPQLAQAIAVADDIAVLARWLRDDVLALAGPAHAERVDLYDFLVAELRARVPLSSTLLGPLVTYLEGQRDDVLAFAAELDGDITALATAFAVPAEQVRALFGVQTLPVGSNRRWQRDALLRDQLGSRYWLLSQALADVGRRCVRASSLVENVNSRLRSYFSLRRHLGNDYLTLLQFFLNHRRYLRSECPERVDKSPAELLTGAGHAHWLELLGYTRFARS